MPSTQRASSKPPRRKFWLYRFFDIKVLMAFMVLAGAIGYPWMNRTNRQIEIYSKLSDRGATIEMGEPLPWLRFLPRAWQESGGRHWFCPIASVRFSPTSLGSKDDRLGDLQESLELISQLTTIQSLQISSLPSEANPQALQQAFAPLAKTSGLQSLTLATKDSLYLILPALPALPKLTSLDLSVTDSGAPELFDHFRKFPRLQSLSFASYVLPIESLRVLASHKFTKSISVSNARYTASELECLKDHPSLQWFATSSIMTDDGLKHLGTCSKLRNIVAGNSLITDVGLSYLTNLSNLEEISLDGTSITDAGFAQLSHLKSLKKISCIGCKLSDAIGPTLNQFTKLQSLNLTDTQITGQVLSHLIPLRNLRFLTINPHTAHIDDVLQFATYGPPLDHDNLSHYSLSFFRYLFIPNGRQPYYTSPANISFRGLKGLTGRFPQIQNLNIFRHYDLSDTDINDQDVEHLSQVCLAFSIQARNTPSAPNAIKHFAKILSLQSLTVEPLNRSSEALQAFTSMPRLNDLTLVGINELSFANKQSISQLSGLHSLTLEDCAFDEQFARELMSLPKLKQIAWRDQSWQYQQVEELRLKLSRESYGIPEGMLQYLIPPRLELNVTIVDERELEYLSNHFVRKLNASGVPLSVNALSKISEFDRLNSLNLSGTGITDDMLQHLYTLRDLRSLDLSNTTISASAIQTLLKLGRLTTLNLANTQIADADLNHLLFNSKLTELDLSGTSITERAWDPISTDSPPRVHRINLSGVVALPAILKQFNSMPGVSVPRIIEISKDYPIGITDLKQFYGGISKNYSHRLDITPQIIQIWSLDEIVRDRQFVSDIRIARTNALANILPSVKRECPLLYQLTLDEESLDVSCLAELPSQLRILKLEHCTLTTQALATILQTCPHLLSLSLDSCNLEQCDLTPLTQATFFNELTIKDTKLAPNQNQLLKQLRAKRKFPEHRWN